MARKMTAPDRLICHVIHRLAVGGLENGLVNLINHLPDDYQHAIICVTDATDFRHRIRRHDVAIHELGKRPGKISPVTAGCGAYCDDCGLKLCTRATSLR
jgi:hypothetical protein